MAMNRALWDDGGDKDARQDMFSSTVTSYNDDDLLGTNATTAAENFDQTHPLFTAFKEFAATRKAHPALAYGAQIHRYSKSGPGIYAFSRFDRDSRVEYLVALNNATTPQRASFATYAVNGSFTAVYPANSGALTSAANGMITVDVPPLSFVIYRSGQPASVKRVDNRAEMGTISFNTLGESKISGRTEIGVSFETPFYAEVTFAVKVGDSAEWTVIGTDANPPYRIFYDVSTLPISTTLTFKAVGNDFVNKVDSATAQAVVVPVKEPGAAGGYAVIHYHRPNGDYDGWGLHLWGDGLADGEATEWAKPKLPNGEDGDGKFFWIKLADPSKAVNFIIHKGDEKDTDPDRSFVPATGRQIWIKQGDTANHANAATALGEVVIHYKRSDSYDGWGLHLWGDGLADGEATEWSAPKLPNGEDSYGKFFVVKVKDASKPINFIVHKGDDKDTPDDRSVDPSKQRQIWLAQGDAGVYAHPGAVEKYVVLHYHRPAGDYTGWGLHLWTGSAEPGVEWSKPLQPTGQDAFGQVYKVRVTADATQLNYILHKGDEKDLPDDQILEFSKNGHEVWVIQGTPGYLLPMK